MSSLIVIIICAVAAVAGYFWRKSAKAQLQGIDKPTKQQKRPSKYALYLIIVALYIMVAQMIFLIFGPAEKKALEVTLAAAPMELFGRPVELFGIEITTTIFYSWIIMAVILIIAIILRITVISRLEYAPKGVQNLLEVMIETATSFTKSSAHGVGAGMSAYIFTVLVFLVGCAALELFGLRTPASDLTFTAGLALVTFVLINFFGIKVKGFGGRVKSLMQPAPFILPIKIITDLAIPVSLSCRLFGNMLGGMVVMDLIYSALGYYAVGIPSVLGLFFNVFHPLIQAFIFVTLTLSFINEATE